eukprot:2974713-Prymnesium_polylepis.1
MGIQPDCVPLLHDCRPGQNKIPEIWGNLPAHKRLVKLRKQICLNSRKNACNTQARGRGRAGQQR